MLRAIREREEFAILIQRNPDGTIDIGYDCSMSPEVSDYIRHEDHFSDAPTEPGCYIAEGWAEYYYHPGDWYSPPEEDTRAQVERYRVYDSELEDLGPWI